MPIKVTYNPDMLATGDLAHAAGRGQFLQEQDRFNEQIRQYDQSLAFKAQLARLENQRAHQAAQEQARQFNLSLDQKDRLAAAEAAMEQQKENRIWDQAQLEAGAERTKEARLQLEAFYEREQDRIQEKRLQQEAEDLKLHRQKQNELGLNRLVHDQNKFDYDQSMVAYRAAEKAKKGQTQEIKDQIDAQWIADYGHKAGWGGKYPTDYQVNPDPKDKLTLNKMQEHVEGLRKNEDPNGDTWINKYIGPATDYGEEGPDGVFRYDPHPGGKSLLSEHRIAGIEAHEKELTQKRNHDATTKKDSAKNDWDRDKYMLGVVETAVKESLENLDTGKPRTKTEREEYVDQKVDGVMRVWDRMKKAQQGGQQEGQQEGLLSQASRFAQTAWQTVQQTAQQVAQQEAQQEDPQVALPEDPQENPMAEVQAAWSQKRLRGGALDEDWVEQKAIAAHELGMTVRPDGINQVGDLPAWTAFEFKGKLYVKHPDGKFLEVTRGIRSGLDSGGYGQDGNRDIRSNRGAF
jgi:hypothetical protein|tara:strand:+ start:11614 stop:13167 length:1554 start_codon:yes stop_codon:yes gene_type:complete